MVERIRHIYERLCDVESKELFLNRFFYSVSGKPGYMITEIKKLPEGESFSELLNTIQERYLFGCGDLGRRLAKTWEGWDGFIDNDQRKQNTKIENLYVYRPDEVNKEAYIFISTRLFYREIVEQLLAMGFEENRIINVGEISDKIAERQYFDLPELKQEEDEVFVDCGALDGETSKYFLEWIGNRYEHIYMFEPDSLNVKKCKNFINARKIKCSLVDKAAWSSKGRVGFESLNNGSSNINELSERLVETTTIDDVVGEKRVSFIKMDIEGAEYEALKGAKETIKRDKPKLAICVYHKDDDIVSIPEVILELNDRYHLYLRHYSLTASETVLYAI